MPDNPMDDAERLRRDPAALNRLIAENRILHETVACAPLLFCVYGADDRLLAWNRVYERNHPAAFAHLRTLPPGTALSFADLVRLDIAAHTAPDILEDEVARRVAEQRAADGTPRLCHSDASGWMQIHKYRLPSGAVAGLGLDVNALKQRETDLVNARQRAEDAEKDKAEVLARISHELRTPLNGILGLAESLTDTALDAGQRTAVDTIITSGSMLLSLINDILDFSRMEAGRMALVQRPFSLLHEAESLCRLLAPRAAEAGIDLILDADPALDAPLLGDAARLRQVMTNLLGNALKFTRDGHIILRLEGQQADGRLDLTIAVEDTGIGIPEAMQDIVFRAFEQVNDPAAGQAAGTGLGLAIAADLMAAMGGTLSLRSHPGQGSVFTARLSLPLAPGGLRAQPAQDGSRGPAHLIDPGVEQAGAMARRLVHLGHRPVHWHDPSAFAASADDGAPVLISHRALPRDRTARDAWLDRMDLRSGPCLLLWGGPGTPPRRPADRLLLEPVPMDDLRAALGAAPPPAPPPRPPTPQQRFDLSVLVAEDNRTNRLVLERMLRPRVAQLAFAENGRIAVQQRTRLHPDLILMDMTMPVLNGIEAARIIRAQETRLGLQPCVMIALTANTRVVDRTACLAAGMNDFLSKPVSLATLIAHLAAVDGARRLSA